jgi:hypothetical protein
MLVGTANEEGLTDKDRFNPDKEIPATADYLKKQYNQINTALQVQYNKQGISATPDPRTVVSTMLSAYNGGAKDVVNAIRAGNTSWDGISAYLKKVKSPAASEENLGYVDKVINASIPFIKGGNTGDDQYLRLLQGMGIMNVLPPAPGKANIDGLTQT